MSAYPIPAASVRAEVDIKKSRFIGIAMRASSPEEAKQFIQDIREEFSDARHHCYGFVAGNPADTQCCGFSDDGEPGGTAGMPILNRLKHSGVGEILVVVVRYFGGIKLGTGGLVRAYGEATQLVLDSLETKELTQMRHFKIQIPFAREAHYRRLIQNQGGTIDRVDYEQTVTLIGVIPVSVEFEFDDEAVLS